MDVRCEDCRFYRKGIPNSFECANNIGDAWNPSEQACNNFEQKNI